MERFIKRGNPFNPNKIIFLYCIMPYDMKKLPSGKYQVSEKSTGKVIAKGTTKAKGEAQIKLIEMMKAKKGKK